jgi:hypothetical protein
MAAPSVVYNLDIFMSLKGCQYDTVDERLAERLAECFQLCAKEGKEMNVVNVGPAHHKPNTSHHKTRHQSKGGTFFHKRKNTATATVATSSSPNTTRSVLKSNATPSPLRTLLGILNKCSDVNFAKMTRAVLEITSAENVAQFTKCIWDHACRENVYHQQYTYMIQELYRMHPEVVMSVLCQEIQDFMKGEWLCITMVSEHTEDYNEFCNRLKSKNAVVGRCKMILGIYASDLGVYAQEQQVLTLYPSLQEFITWFVSLWNAADMTFDSMESLELSMEQYLTCVLYIVEYVPETFLGAITCIHEVMCAWCIHMEKIEMGKLSPKIKFKLQDIRDRFKQI